MSLDPTALEQNMTLERLKSLYELIGRMNSVYNLQELLEFVVDRVLSLTGGRRGLLLLVEDGNPTVQDVAVVRGKQFEQSDLEQILNMVSTTVIKDVLDRGETRLVTDITSDKRYEGVTSVDTLFNKRVRSVLAVPLKAQTQAVGLMYIDHPKKAIFGQGELEFIIAFANQAAQAIHRAREHQRQIEKLTLLNQLSRSVVQVLDLDEVLTRIVTEVTKMLNVESSSVLLLNESTEELSFATSVFKGERLNINARLKKDQGIAGWVMSHGQATYVNNVPQDPRWFGEVESNFVTRSLLCAPLQMNGKPVGVIEAINKQNPTGFDSDDITLLSAFAASATIAIENARLFQEVQQARQLRELNEIAMTLSSTLDLNKILEEGLQQSLHILKAEAGALNLINDQSQTDLLTIQLGDTPPNSKQEQAVSGLTAWLLGNNIDTLLTNDVLVINSTAPDAAAPNATQITLNKTGILALAMAPIKVGGTISGGLAIISTTPHTYSQNEISLLSSIARIIGLAAQNAIQYTQVQGQTVHLKYLNDIGSALTRSLDVDHVLRFIIEGVNTLLQTDLTSVFLIDKETNELVLRYSTKGNVEIRLQAPWQGIAGWVATNDEPALVNNTQGDPRHLRKIALETGYQADSILCVPLKVEGQVIGVVEVLNKIGGQQFTNYHQSLLVELTKWAAIALHNARLFDERVQAYERLNTEQQRRIAAETRGAMAAIILDIAHTMNNVVGAIRAWAMSMEYAVADTPDAPIVNFEAAIRRMRQNTEEAIKLMSTMTGPLEQAEVQLVDVHHCLGAAVESCWWPDNVHLTKTFGQNIPPVEANPERLEAVFHNLLSNAVQAMRQEGGQIQISTHRTSENQVEIIFTDNGPGIPPELQQRVFNPGVSGKTGGLGIGLWLVETFIHQFNGTIDFVSTENKGTTFTVTLPLAETQQHPENNSWINK